ncbi:MAG: hypothetical protein UR22_C0002G0051 [Parcubacteria group bacterium GW2011_GWC2_32_10]|nr:MAG: hypothetical protein UR22_C0002G0051 [Parcubacteria group bacterium GW2011_GWC2_32_10]
MSTKYPNAGPFDTKDLIIAILIIFGIPLLLIIWSAFLR